MNVSDFYSRIRERFYRALIHALVRIGSTLVAWLMERRMR